MELATVTTDTSATAELFRLVASAEFRSIPPAVIRVAKAVILYGFSITLAASLEEMSQIAADQARDGQRRRLHGTGYRALLRLPPQKLTRPGGGQN